MRQEKTEPLEPLIQRAWSSLAEDGLRRLGAVRWKAGKEPVRKLRKIVRLLEFCLEEWGSLAGGSKLGRTRKDLRRLARALGPARDAAIYELCAGRAAKAARADLSLAGKALSDRLRLRRKSLVWPVVDEADSLLAGDGAFPERLVGVRWTASGAGTPVNETVVPRIAEATRRIVALGACLSGEDDEPRRHEMRKLARAPIAVAQLAGAGTDCSPAAELETLRKDLGDLHDLEITRDHLRLFRTGELAASGKLDAYGHLGSRPGEREEHLERFFDHAEAWIAEERDLLLRAARKSWPDLRERLLSGAGP